MIDALIALLIISTSFTTSLELIVGTYSFSSSYINKYQRIEVKQYEQEIEIQDLFKR